MLNYVEFKELVVNTLSEAMCNIDASYADYELSEIVVMKNNGVRLDTIIFRKKGEKVSVTPNLYVQELYSGYSNSSGDAKKYIQEVAEYLDARIKEAADIFPDQGEEAISDPKIIMTLVNRDKNAVLLQNVPHLDFLDLAVVFRLLVGSDNDGIQTTLITYAVAHRLEMSTEELYAAAKSSTPELCPFKETTLQKIICSLCGIEEEDLPDLPNDPTMPYVFTNENGVYGASVILYDHVLEYAAEKMDSDLILLPSSIHEWLTISANTTMGYDEISEMVHSVNADVVEPEELLSDNIYIYSRENKEIHIIPME